MARLSPDTFEASTVQSRDEKTRSFLEVSIRHPRGEKGGGANSVLRAREKRPNQHFRVESCSCETAISGVQLASLVTPALTLIEGLRIIVG